MNLSQPSEKFSKPLKSSSSSQRNSALVTLFSSSGKATKIKLESQHEKKLQSSQYSKKPNKSTTEQVKLESNDFELLNIFYCGDGLSIDERERKIEELLKENEELRNENANLRRKIKKLQSDNSELFQSISDQLTKSLTCVNSAKKQIDALITHRVLLFQNEEITLSNEDLKELKKLQPVPALTHLCKLLKENNLLQDGGELLLMPGNMNNIQGKKITQDFRDELVACAELNCPQISKKKIEKHLGAALKEVTNGKEGSEKSNKKKKAPSKRKTYSDSN